MNEKTKEKINEICRNRYNNYEFVELGTKNFILYVNNPKSFISQEIIKDFMKLGFYPIYISYKRGILSSVFKHKKNK